MTFRHALNKLCAPLDPAKHADESALLQSCRTLADLNWLGDNDGGWLTKTLRGPRLKLVRHGSGTFLVVEYLDGWSKTISQAPFSSR